MLTGIYIDAMYLRMIWLFHCNKLGYVDAFNQKYNHWIPNSTDVHSLKKIRSVSNYVGKYMSKESDGRAICGHTWGRSDGMDKLIPYTFTISLELHEWFNMQRDSLINREFIGKRFSVNTFMQKMNLRSLPTGIKKHLIEITNENLNHLNLFK